MEYYEQSKETNKCQYNLTVESCRKCLFETLCRLEKQKRQNNDLDTDK